MKSPWPLWPVLFLLALPGSVTFADAAEVELRLVLQVHGEDAAKATEAQVARTAEVLRNRLGIAGVGHPEITVSGDRISVRAGGVEDPDRVRRLLLSHANLEFRFVRFPDSNGSPSREGILQNYGGTLPPDLEILEGDQLGNDGAKIGTVYYAVDKERAAGGEGFESVRPSMGQFDQPMLEFKLDPEAAAVFGDMTEANVGTALGIVLNGKVVSAPVIRSRITDAGIIEGNFTLQEVQDLAAVLSSGALTAPLTVLEEERKPVPVSKGARSFLFVLVAIAGFLAAGGLYAWRQPKRPPNGGAGQG